jgi:hypothetical protein
LKPGKVSRSITSPKPFNTGVWIVGVNLDNTAR